MAALTGMSFKPTVAHPVIVLVSSAIDTKTGRPVTCGVPAWHMDSNGNVVVDGVPGLAPGGSYDVTFVVMG